MGWDHAHLPDQGMADVVNDLVHDRSSNTLFAVGSYQTLRRRLSQAFRIAGPAMAWMVSWCG